MKKFLFTILVVFNVFMIAGCSDSDDDNGGPTDNLFGTYNVTSFGTQLTNAKADDSNSEFFLSYADVMYVSNDCAKAKELYPDIINRGEGDAKKNQCPTENDEGNPITGGTAELLDGVVVINNEDGKLGITSRVQLGGQIMDTFAPADKYQFTEYYPTDDFVNYAGKGVTGWNYDSVNNKPSATSSEFPESPYKITKQDDGSLRIDMTLVGKKVDVMGMANLTVDAVTTVIMTKVDDSTEPLENEIKKEFPAPSDDEE